MHSVTSSFALADANQHAIQAIRARLAAAATTTAQQDVGGQQPVATPTSRNAGGLASSSQQQQQQPLQRMIPNPLPHHSSQRAPAGFGCQPTNSVSRSAMPATLVYGGNMMFMGGAGPAAVAGGAGSNLQGLGTGSAQGGQQQHALSTAPGTQQGIFPLDASEWAKVAMVATTGAGQIPSHMGINSSSSNLTMPPAANSSSTSRHKHQQLPATAGRQHQSSKKTSAQGAAVMKLKQQQQRYLLVPGSTQHPKSVLNTNTSGALGGYAYGLPRRAEFGPAAAQQLRPANPEHAAVQRMLGTLSKPCFCFSQPTMQVLRQQADAACQVGEAYSSVAFLQAALSTSYFLQQAAATQVEGALLGEVLSQMPECSQMLQSFERQVQQQQLQQPQPQQQQHQHQQVVEAGAVALAADPPLVQTSRQQPGFVAADVEVPPLLATQPLWHVEQPDTVAGNADVGQPGKDWFDVTAADTASEQTVREAAAHATSTPSAVEAAAAPWPWGAEVCSSPTLPPPAAAEPEAPSDPVLSVWAEVMRRIKHGGSVKHAAPTDCNKPAAHEQQPPNGSWAETSEALALDTLQAVDFELPRSQCGLDLTLSTDSEGVKNSEAVCQHKEAAAGNPLAVPTSPAPKATATTAPTAADVKLPSRHGLDLTSSPVADSTDMTGGARRTLDGSTGGGAVAPHTPALQPQTATVDTVGSDTTTTPRSSTGAVDADTTGGSSSTVVRVPPGKGSTGEGIAGQSTQRSRLSRQSSGGLHQAGEPEGAGGAGAKAGLPQGRTGIQAGLPVQTAVPQPRRFLLDLTDVPNGWEQGMAGKRQQRGVVGDESACKQPRHF